MKIVVDGPTASVVMHETNDTDRLSVVLRDTSADRASQIMGALGHVDGEHAWLDITSLHSFGPIPRSCSWDQRFAQTMVYAQVHGWTDGTGRYVRAAVESVDAVPGAPAR